MNTPLQQFVYLDKYSRFRYDLGRRETWEETVTRSYKFLKLLVDENANNDPLTDDEWNELFEGMLNMDFLPSMRLMASAGEAAEKDNARIYNCSYITIDSIDSFPEVLALSMAGVGIGYSVERKYVNELPIVMRQSGNVRYHTIEDSTEGWINALRLGIHSWWNGDDVIYNYNLLRPAGAIIKSGGRASGPEVLKDLFDFTRTLILEHQGRKLSPINCHDIVTKIGDCVVSGGVRRTAYLALFDYDDERMATCKSPENIIGNENRFNANNSLVLPDRHITQKEIFKWMGNMLEGGTGEPGLFNRNVAIPERREKRDDFGPNACAEIILRPRQFCNLTTVVVKENDNEESLRRKIKYATIIGTIQSLATHFPMLGDDWIVNAEDERLLGVSITGYFDNALVRKPSVLQALKKQALQTNNAMANSLGINVSAAVTAIKPSGNSSQLVDASSGIHPRWSQYYIRRVRLNVESPIYKLLKASGMRMTPENGQSANSATTWVASFPTKSPDGAITKDDISAIEMLEHWLNAQNNYSEHNVSITIPYDEDEWIDIVKWVYDHQNDIAGVTFIPKSNANYEQMPYESIDRKQYDKMISEMPRIEWERISEFEKEDMTTSSHEVACSAGVCEADFFGVKEYGNDKNDFAFIISNEL